MFLIAANIVALVLWTRASAVTTRASLPTAALTLVGSVSLLVLSYVEHLYSYRTSTILNIFMLFTTLFDAARTRTLWLQGYNRPIAIVLLVTTVLKIAILGFELRSKRPSLRSPFLALPPEATSGILARWLFTWQLSLFRTGYSKRLEIDDLFGLDKHLQSQCLHGQVRGEWKQSLLCPVYSLGQC